jgi:hypothetical protein
MKPGNNKCDYGAKQTKLMVQAMGSTLFAGFAIIAILSFFPI